MSQKAYAPRRKIVLLGATALVAGLASPLAYAQNTVAPATSVPTGPATPQGATPAVPEATEQVVVTGTRIQNTNANSANPLTVVTAKEIAQSSAQNVEDVLNKLPAIGSSGLYGTTNNGGVGLSCTDIRNLGITRVLVLVDGKRFVHDSDGVGDCVDLNNIPLQMIDHIEVLKDGASSLYGADAVSGVVNIIMKRNFTGTTATLEGDLPTTGSGSEGQLSVTSGQSFDQGNFTLGLEYLNRSPLSQKDRNWANRINSGYVGGVGNDFGSGSIPYGRIANLRLRATGNNTVVPYNRSTDTYDFAPAQDLVGGLEKEGLSALGHVDFNEYMTGYVEAFFTHKVTTQQLAPEPVYTNSSAALPDNGQGLYFIVPPGNPYLADYTDANGNTVTSLLGGSNALVRKRLTELGPREYVQDTDTIEVTTGLRGVLPYDVNYDAYYTYGHSSSVNQTKNSANIANLEQVVGYSYTPSTFGIGGTYDPSVCPSFGCTNPFALSPAAAKYVAFTETDTSKFNLRTYGLDLSKNNVLSLPYGGLGLAFGFDHREESGFYNTDGVVAAGLTNESPQQPTGGGFSVTEVYGETRIPILADLPFAKELSADLSGRYFSYNTFGSGETWKASANYTVIDDIRLRASIGTSFRQPSVNELYTSPVNSANGFVDPCDTSNGALTPVVAANCASKGVPANFVNQETQVNTLIGGNPNLQPETARTETLGLILKPRFLPNSALTVDYYRTKINNSIGALTSQTIISGCYGSINLSSPLCNLIGPRDSLSQLTSLVATNQNLGVTRTSGLDFGVTYNLPLGDFGAVSLNNQMEYVMNYLSQDLPNGPFIDSVGTLTVVGPGNYAYPRVKDNNSITWANGALSFTYTTRFISGMDYFNDPTTPPAVYTKADGYRVTSTPNIFYHDIEGTYTYRTATFTVGIDNLLNQNPPFVPDTATNTNTNIYDVIGRLVYAKLSYHF